MATITTDIRTAHADRSTRCRSLVVAATPVSSFVSGRAPARLTAAGTPRMTA